MFSKAPRRVTAELDLIPFTFEEPPGDLEWVACAACETPLVLHQLEIQAPYRLIGVCGACGRWYLIVMEPELGSAIMVAMPENQFLQAAWNSHVGPEGGPALDGR